MKTIIKSLIIAIILFSMLGCEDPGVSIKRLTGAEDNLPPELRGLKVYSVSIGDGNWVKVAVLNNNINSLTYSEGKTQTTTIVINQNNQKEKVIHARYIISENDSIIVLKK